MKIRSKIAWLATGLAFAISAAVAGSGTIVVKDGGGTNRTYDVVTDGSGNFVAKNVLCDQSAAANCATVSSNALKVDNSGVTQPVSGTVTANIGTVGTLATAAKQPALGTAGTASSDVISVQGITSMTPLLATLSGTNNINNIAGTVSLPTGASTAAKQPALGTAGSPSSDVITVQGSGSGTALPVSLASVPSHAVTNAGTFLVQAAQSGTWTNTVTQATGTNLHMVCDSGCAGSGGTSSSYGSAFPAAGTAIGISNGTNMVAPVQVSNGANIAATGIPGVGLLGQCDDTSPQAITENSWGNIRLDCTYHSLRVLSVDANGTAADFTSNTGTNAKQINGTTILTGGVAGSQGVGGLAGNNASTSGNPVPVSALATSAEASLATNGQNAEFVTDLAHKQIVLPYANPENFVSGVITSAMTGTTSTSLVASPGGALRNYITQLVCTNSHATVGTFIAVQDGSGGTTIYEAYAAAVGGGFSISFPTPLRQPTTATALYVADVTTGANVICSASGYKGV